MPLRARLPNRRVAETVSIVHDGQRFIVTVGFDTADRPREVFARAEKPDSAIDLLADDLGVLVSLLLQHGIPVSAIRHSIGRLQGQPASLVGRIVDLLGQFTSS